MKDQFAPDVSPEERLRRLRDNCDSHNTETYTRKLTPDELTANRERVTDCMIEIDNANDILKNARAIHKDTVKPLAEEKQMLLKSIKSKHMELTGELYHFADYEARTITTYDENGIWVGDRRMRPDEGQTNVFNLKQAM